MSSSTASSFPIKRDLRFGCVIMASGMSSRFGSNKLTASFRGKPLILCALDVSKGLFDHLVVVTRHAQVASICRGEGVEVILHSLPYRSDTVRLGLEALGIVDACLFLPGDQPLLRRETVCALLDAAQQNPQAIWRTAFDGVPGAPVLFPKWCFAELLALPQGKGGSLITKKYPERVCLMPVRDAYELHDVDTPQDLSFLEAQME